MLFPNITFFIGLEEKIGHNDIFSWPPPPAETEQIGHIILMADWSVVDGWIVEAAMPL